MHVLVLGAGVVGVTTAYYLAKSGCRVTVVDRAGDVAQGTSFANAGQLSYSFTDALAKPSLLAELPRILMGRDRGMRVRIDVSFFVWGIKFVAQCTDRRASRNTLALLDAALRSSDLMKDVCDDVSLEFAHRRAGKLVLLPDASALRHAARMTTTKNERGCDVDVLSASETIRVEPAVASMRDRFAGAVYARGDDVGDARMFSEGLKKHLENTDQVTFRFDAVVTGLLEHDGAVDGVRLEDEELTADATVVCLGASSRQLLKRVGIPVPIYPVRGYSVTLPAGSAPPDVSTTIQEHRIVFSRIGDRMRIAGFADFRGFDTSRDAERVRALLDIARRIAPEAARYDVADVRPWGGFRPMTPDGQPLVGAVGKRGLFINTGHGMLGWTLGCATAYDIAKTVIDT